MLRDKYILIVLPVSSLYTKRNKMNKVSAYLLVDITKNLKIIYF
jgi:hypothetical protein